MIQKNNKISNFQIFAMLFLIGNALFVGMGNVLIVNMVKENTWIVGSISIILGILPIFFLCKLMNYEPNLNIFEKTKKLFGKLIGNILNIFLALIMAFVFMIIIWAMGNFASTKYLTETPVWFLSLLFMIPIVYVNIKGAESIFRVIELLFYFSIIIHITISSSLTQFADLENIKPILAYGTKNIPKAIFNFIVYAYTPFLALLCIPKNNILKPEKTTKFIVLGYLATAFMISFVFFMNMAVVGERVLSMYKYPEYYIIKKLSLSPIFDNVENFLSLHWMFNLISAAFLTSYFIKTYFLTSFKKLKTSKPIFINIIMAILCLIIIFLVSITFKSTTTQAKFMLIKFPLYVGLPLLTFPLIITIIAFIKSKINKNVKTP